MKEYKAVLVARSQDWRNGIINLSRQAFIHGFDEIVEEVYGTVDGEFVRTHLHHWDALFIEGVEQLGSTQEAVLSTLMALVRDTGIKVFFVYGRQNAMEVDLAGVGLLDAFRQLDVILRATA